MTLREVVRIPERAPKPRTSGMTMVAESGMSPRQLEDALVTMGDYIDNVRMGRASAVIFPESVVRAKADLCRRYDVDFETGGPLFEIAKIQNRVAEFFAAARDSGFTSVEISENIFELTPQELEVLFHQARSYGLDSYFEYGRKYPDSGSFRMDDAVARIRIALEAGAKKVVVERAEIDILIDKEREKLLELSETLGMDNLVFEAGPGKPDYAAKLIRILGTDVNLGNVSLTVGAPDGIYWIENARRGLGRETDYAFIAQGANPESFSFKGSQH